MGRGPASAVWPARYLVLCEPTSSLDLAFKHQILTVAHWFAVRNVAVLVVWHDLNLAVQYADRILCWMGAVRSPWAHHTKSCKPK